MSEYNKLYLARFDWRDGENEYSNDEFVKADNDEEAHAIALAYVKSMFGEETEPVDEPDSWQTTKIGYPAVKLAFVRKVNSLEDIIYHIGSIN